MVAGMAGILFSGGHDINPQEYGEDAKSYCGTIMPMQDRQDVDLARYIINETGKSGTGNLPGNPNSSMSPLEEICIRIWRKRAGSAIISMICIR